MIRSIDASVKGRFDGIASYTVTEHYAVFRGGDQNHPAAEMTVKTDYKRESGKSYTILAESGSAVIRRLVLHAILENERRVNEPMNRESSWLTSRNYEMKLHPGGPERQNGHDCFVLSIHPRQKSPSLFDGTVWVDARDESLVEFEGTASKSGSMFLSPAQVMRQYVNMDGFSEATHARAIADSHLFGQTIITIDYQDYDIRLRSAR